MMFVTAKKTLDSLHPDFCIFYLLTLLSRRKHSLRKHQMVHPVVLARIQS